ncbi:site-2 protease family protein [Mycobacterium sp. MYCO198283]|uniref:site-2 protease family protein n=1 Tax=Mycobacterium sp. MYCO198283 TaxID=2883505 RepID=UPI001E3996B3|nr:site-2 protease family protein [Mycobacterium sp. MYCO198283]MCG5432147.1 site-2 protease family protein [Mycobacterium sp. MYCO198283]
MSIRPLRESVRPSPVFVAIVGITALGGGLAWTAGDDDGFLAHVGVFVFVIAGWLVSLCLHEFGHAVTAWRFGDRDVAVRGYLSLNPLRYTDPMLSIALPALFIALGGIGLPGGAVYLQTSWMTAARRTVVSLAGPLANVVLAVLLLATARLLAAPGHLTFWAAVAFLAFLQVTAVVLNLLPVPGLDGYGALEPHLSPQTQRSLQPVKAWGVLVIFVLLFVPALNQAFFSAVYGLVELSGVPRALAWYGGGLTRFWSGWL